MKRFIIMLAIVTNHLAILHAQTTTPTQWQARGTGGGGALYSPSISPHDGNDCYLSCDMGLLSHSTNSGVNWQTVNLDTVTGFRNSIVNFTNHPDTMYVLRFDGANARYFPAVSRNHGITWDTLVNGNNNFWGAYGVFRLYANPNNSRQVLVANLTNVYFSNDWGTTFTQIHTSVAQGTAQMHLAGAVYTDDTIFASTDKGLLISPNNGNSWSYTAYSTMNIPTTTEAVVSFNGGQKNGATRFFCTTIDNTKMSPKTESRDMQYFKNIYRLNWNGAPTWTKITDSLFTSSNVLDIYNVAYYVVMNHTNNIDTFYLSGQTRYPILASGSKYGEVFRSFDGGQTFKNVFLKNHGVNNTGFYTGWAGDKNWAPSISINAWVGINTIEGLCVDPKNNLRLMSSDFYAPYLTEDAGNTWHQRYTDTTYETQPGTLIPQNRNYKSSGLQVTVCYWMQWMDSLNMLGSFADLMMNKSADGGQSWNFTYDSLWGKLVNDIHMICKAPSGKLYVPMGEVLGNNGDWSENRVTKASAGKVMSSVNTTQWKIMKNFGVPVSWICFDPNDSTKMYAACYSSMDSTQGGIWRCTNPASNPQWTKLAEPPRTQRRATQIFCLKDGSLVAVYGARDTGVVAPSYKYTASSGVFISNNGGSSWTDLCATQTNMQYDVRYLMLDPSDTTENTWLVSVCNNGGPTGQPGLYRTINRGQEWTNVMPATRVNTITFHPSHPDEMYVCTERNGLYYAIGANTFSPVLTRIPSYPYRSPQRAFFNPYNQNEVWITSAGNGMRVGYVPVAIDTTITSVGNSLPVELISFDVYAIENAALLQWETAIEFNNEKFEVERSADAISFQKIGEVLGNGNSTSLKEYSFTDANAHDFASQKNQTVVYYRLKQIDYDGAFEYTEIEALNFSGSNFLASLLFPNPAQSNTRIEYELSDASDVEISVYDLNGRKIISLSDEHQTAGKHFLDFNTELLTAGIYFVRMNAGGIICKKLVKQ